MNSEFDSRPAAALAASLVLLVAFTVAGCDESTSPDESGGAPVCASNYLEASTPLRLVMPFAEGSEWTVGGAGSFFGEGAHTNSSAGGQLSDGEYFATDWNCCGGGDNDLGEPLYPMAPGRVSHVRSEDPGTTGYGKFVIVVHPGDPPFRTRYAHLDDVTVDEGDVVFTTTEVGTVGNTGTGSAHLHLAFQRWTGEHWRSKSYYDTASDAQSRKPSPMWTAAGSTELCPGANYTAAKGVSVFHDVNPAHDISRYITSVYAHGYAIGCSNEPQYNFCPYDPLTRAEMAVILVRSEHGPDFVPPDPSQSEFADVPVDAWYSKWVHQAYYDYYTDGCWPDPLLYCPFDQLTRTELAVFMLRARHRDPDYEPPAATGVFADMEGHWGAEWAEAAYDEGIMEPCRTQWPYRYFCPESAASRALMAKALAKAKYLPVPSKP